MGVMWPADERVVWTEAILKVNYHGTYYSYHNNLSAAIANDMLIGRVGCESTGLQTYSL